MSSRKAGAAIGLLLVRLAALQALSLPSTIPDGGSESGSGNGSIPASVDGAGKLTESGHSAPKRL